MYNTQKADIDKITLAPPNRVEKKLDLKLILSITFGMQVGNQDMNDLRGVQELVAISNIIYQSLSIQLPLILSPDNVNLHSKGRFLSFVNGLFEI